MIPPSAQDPSKIKLSLGPSAKRYLPYLIPSIPKNKSNKCMSSIILLIKAPEALKLTLFAKSLLALKLNLMLSTPNSKATKTT